jgi:hypothetical protein
MNELMNGIKFKMMATWGIERRHDNQPNDNFPMMESQEDHWSFVSESIGNQPNDSWPNFS